MFVGDGGKYDRGELKCHFGKSLITIHENRIDFENVVEFTLLRQFINTLSDGCICYADALHIIPSEVFPDYVYYQAPSPEKKNSWLWKDHIQSFYLGKFDAMRLRSDIEDWRFVGLYFSDPMFTWADFLKIRNRTIQEGIMREELIQACFCTGNNDGSSLYMRTSYMPKVIQFLEQLEEIGIFTQKLYATTNDNLHSNSGV